MSSRSYFVKGFGFSVKNIKIENTLRFIQKHGGDLMKTACHDDCYYSSMCELLEAIHNENIGADYKITGELAEKLEEMNVSEFDDCYWGLDIVRDIINEIYDLQVCFERGQDDCIGEPSLMIPIMLPWEYSDRLRNSNSLEIKRILEGFANELGVASDVEELEVEYYG